MIAQTSLPPWAASPVVVGLATAGVALLSVFIGKWMERGKAERERRDKRRQALLDAYGAWLTSFEEMLQDYAGYYAQIAWTRTHGPGRIETYGEPKPKEGTSPHQKFTGNSWRLRLLERDAQLAEEIEELSRAFNHNAEDFSDLTAQALGWPDEMKRLRNRAGRVFQRMQSPYLQRL
jgi:hypothetical protein